MGIREHFKEHKEEETKLSDFSLDVEGEEKPFFDVEKEMTDEEWEIIIQYLREYRDQEDWQKFLRIGFWVNLLAPNRFKTVGAGPLSIGNIKRYLDDKLNENMDVMISEISRVKTMFPEIKICRIISGQTVDVNEDAIFDHAVLELNHLANNKNDVWSFCDLAFYLKLAYPKRFEEDVQIDNVLRGRILAKCHDLFSKGELSVIGIDFYMKAKTILGRLDFDEDEKHKLYSSYERRKEQVRQDSIRNIDLVDNVLALKMAQAERVEVTSRGLKFIMPEKDFKVEKKSRPERKTF